MSTSAERSATLLQTRVGCISVPQLQLVDRSSWLKWRYPLDNLPQWPTTLFPSPPTLLEICPSLRHVSLELPLPPLTLSNAEKHDLEILSLPRPKQEFWFVLERLLPKLPRLRFVRARDVKWLRGGMSDRARQAGVQGEMLLWRKRLLRRGICLLDAEWKVETEDTGRKM